MPIPSWQELLLPLLKAVSDGNEHTLSACKSTIADDLQLAADERSQLAPDGSYKVFDNRVQWAKLYLVKAKLVESTGYGRLKITQRGQYLIEIEPKRLSMRFLNIFPEYVQSQNPKVRRVFVSHARDSLVYCATLVDKLRQRGFDVWYDEHNLHSGDITETIEQEMLTRECFVLVLSPEAVNSQFVRQEYTAAVDLLRDGNVKAFMPVMASNCAVPLLLRNFRIIAEPGLQCIDVDKAAAAVVEVVQNTN